MRLLVIFVLFLVASSLHAAQPRIAWFSTLQEDLSEKSGFWKRVHDLVLASSEDLYADTTIYYAEENYIRLIEQVEDVLSNPATRPDGIIFHNYKRTGEKILSIAEKYGVKSLIFNSGFSGPKASGYLPRTQYKHWIGEILPDDGYAGSELFRQLTRSARVLPGYTEETKIKLLAMEGNLSSAAYLSRKQGLLTSLKEDKTIEFTQFIPADWSRSVARSKFASIIRRYPEIKVMWAANDNMALGLIDGANNHPSVPGKDYVVGGIDWLPESFDAIKSGKMAATIGGHFVEGMWALLLMYDYLNGHDFAEAYGTSLRTKMLAVTKASLDQYGDLSGKLRLDNLRKVNFNQFTFTGNSTLESYPFNIEHLVKQLQ